MLVSFGSLRRSLFSSDEERQAFLQRILSGTLHILQNQIGLSAFDGCRGRLGAYPIVPQGSGEY